MKGVMGL